MLSPRRSGQPPSDVDQRNQQAPSNVGSEEPLEQSARGALDHLTVPPRPTIVDNPIDEAQSSLPSPESKRGDSSTRSQDKGTAPREFPLQPRLFVESLREAISTIVEKVQEFIHNDEITTTRKVLTIGGCTATVIGAFLYSIPCGLGALCLVTCKLGDTLTENKHGRPYSAFTASTLSAHYTTLENDAMALSSEVYACRMLVQSMIPESRTLTTLAVTAAGVGLSSYLFCSTAGFTPEVSLRNAPLLVTFLHGISSSLPSARGGTTRLMNVTCSSLMIPFHCMVSGSGFLATLSTIWLYGSCKNILLKDLPRWRGSTDTTKDAGPDAVTSST